MFEVISVRVDDNLKDNANDNGTDEWRRRKQKMFMHRHIKSGLNSAELVSYAMQIAKL